MITSLGEARRRQEAAKRRGERFAVADDVREARGRVLAEREAAREQTESDAKTKQKSNPTALQAIMARGTIDELAEVSRSIGLMDPRRLGEVANEAFRVKSRSQPYRPDDAVAGPMPIAPQRGDDGVALEAGGSVQVSSGRRGPGRPKRAA